MPRTLSSRAVAEDADEVTSQVLAKGLLEKMETRNGTRYEITESGWQFLREYEKIRAGLAENASMFVEKNDDLLTTRSSLSESSPPKPELNKPLGDLKDFSLQYEAIKPDISVVIPTRNEVNSIRSVLSEIPQHVPYNWEILVVDGSDDETPLVAAKFEARVLRQVGQGKGTALRQAFSTMDSDIVVIMDGDGSMQAKEISRLVEAVVSGADIAKGSRFLKNGGSQDLSSVRKLGNYLFVNMVNFLWSAKYTDLCYGFMAFRRGALERLKPYLKSTHFQIETEICIRAKKLGLKVVEVPSVELKRRHGQSKLSGVRDSLQIFSVILHEFRSQV
jgi:cellulose synthase/poly-beta-1,6-N-acetylglucosamine synthase-like glycosyltransferase